jgi:hypothetical protein
VPINPVTPSRTHNLCHVYPLTHDSIIHIPGPTEWPLNTIMCWKFLHVFLGPNFPSLLHTCFFLPVPAETYRPISATPCHSIHYLTHNKQLSNVFPGKLLDGQLLQKINFWGFLWCISSVLKNTICTTFPGHCFYWPRRGINLHTPIPQFLFKTECIYIYIFFFRIYIYIYTHTHTHMHVHTNMTTHQPTHVDTKDRGSKYLWNIRNIIQKYVA